MLALILFDTELLIVTVAIAVEVAVRIGFVAGRRPAVVHGRLEVVAAGAVDLKGHVVGERLGVAAARVPRRVLRMRSGKCVGRDLLEQAARRRIAHIGHVYLDGDCAGICRRGRSRALHRAAFLHTADIRRRCVGLVVCDHVREARADRAQVDTLCRTGVEGGLVGGRVRHCRVVDGVAHLPAGDVLQKGRGQSGGGRERVGEVDDLCDNVQGLAVRGQVQSAAHDIHPGNVRSADHREQRVACGVGYPANGRVRGTRHKAAVKAHPRRLSRHGWHRSAGVIDELRSRLKTRLDQAVRGVVVDDLGRAGAVDRDREEVGQVPVALLLNAVGACKANVVVVHGMWRDLDQCGRWRRTRDRSGVRISREHDLAHEHIPRLAVLAAGIDILVGAVPDGVRPPRPAGLDPREDVNRVTRGRLAVTHLHGHCPIRPAAGSRGHADEDLPWAGTTATGSERPDDEQIAGSIHREHSEQRVRISGEIVGNVNQVAVIRSTAGRRRGIEEGEVTVDVGRPDVEQQVVLAAARLREPGGLEDLAGLLVNRRVAVGPERAVDRLAGNCSHAVRSVRVVEPVGALVPLRAAVRPRADDVVVDVVYERRRAYVGGLVRDDGWRVVDREPRAVGSGVRAAAEEVLHDGRAPVRGRGHSVTGECVKIDEVLLAGVVEVDVGVAPAWRVLEARERVRRARSDHPKRVPAVY